MHAHSADPSVTHRAGITPVDHRRHNRSALRRQSEANKERKQAEAQAAAQAEASAQQRRVRMPSLPGTSR